MREFFQLFFSFARIGLFTFGGGLAMLPMLQAEVVDKRKWATQEELLNYYAIGQCTPGIIAVNTATFIGYKQKKIRGAIVATAGMVMPSLVIIIAIAAVLSNFTHIIWVQSAFAGIRVAVAVLIVDALIKLWKAGIKDTIGIALFFIAFAILVFTNISSVYVILFGITAGILIQSFKEHKSAGKGENKS